MNKMINNYRNSIVLIHDILAVIVAWVFSYLLRFNFVIPLEHLDFMLSNLVVVVIIHVASFMAFRVFLASWRFSSLNDLIKISLSIFISGLLLLLFLILSYDLFGVPRSILILNPILLVLFMGGSRLLYRALNENVFISLKKTKNISKNVVVLGSGKEAIGLIKNLKLNNVIVETLSNGKIKTMAIIQTPDKPARRLDILYSPPEEYAFAVLYFTGSKMFNIGMRKHAL